MSRGRGAAAAHTVDEAVCRSRWFAVLSRAAQERVRGEVQGLFVPQGSALCRRGDQPRHWYGTVDGLLKWSVGGEDGRAVSLGGLSRGSWFGEGTLLRGEPQTADIIALRDSQVARLHGELFDWLRSTERGFADFLLQQINERLHWFLGNFAALHLQDVDSNVVRALVGLFHPWLHPDGDLHLQLSQEEIAQLAGVSRQRCNAALKRLAAAGLITVTYGAITIVDLAALRARVPP